MIYNLSKLTRSTHESIAMLSSFNYIKTFKNVETLKVLIYISQAKPVTVVIRGRIKICIVYLTIVSIAHQ
jgi:hypothetical protein